MLEGLLTIEGRVNVNKLHFAQVLGSELGKMHE